MVKCRLKTFRFILLAVAKKNEFFFRCCELNYGITILSCWDWCFLHDLASMLVFFVVSTWFKLSKTQIVFYRPVPCTFLLSASFNLDKIMFLLVLSPECWMEIKFFNCLRRRPHGIHMKSPSVVRRWEYRDWRTCFSAFFRPWQAIRLLSSVPRVSYLTWVLWFLREEDLNPGLELGHWFLYRVGGSLCVKPCYRVD
jgi:hypothetical protein